MRRQRYHQWLFALSHAQQHEQTKTPTALEGGGDMVYKRVQSLFKQASSGTHSSRHTHFVGVPKGVAEEGVAGRT